MHLIMQPYSNFEDLGAAKRFKNNVLFLNFSTYNRAIIVENEEETEDDIIFYLKKNRPSEMIWIGRKGKTAILWWQWNWPKFMYLILPTEIKLSLT